MKIHRCEQRSEEWLEVRCGKITGTGFKNVLNKKTGRGTYMLELIAELRTSEPVEDGFINGYMLNGIALEDEAVAAYEDERMCQVQKVGFLELNKWVGFSPDGLVSTKLVEIKCPKHTTHISYILSNKLPATYKAQVQGGLWVSGAESCDFVSYCPRDDDKPLHIINVERDEEYIKNLAKECKRFITEMQSKMALVAGIKF